MILKKDNVERVTKDPAKIEKLKSEGFKELEEAEEKKEEREIELSSMSVSDMKSIAKEKGISGYSSLTKEQLMEALKDVV